ncbi:permease-like cell division protein FtsX [Dokdonella sp.]|uniref:permease-like cell division protein FtsX n=1 Tax=Dokdonella sp. TaxID=2291710 RepID=UPI001B257F05|nr:permease-like cell division protein FtsX [Dokdonella sp.]MBO9662073.1 permease-like cell division protein FtsX [Dokdonella sp.]
MSRQAERNVRRQAPAPKVAAEPRRARVPWRARLAAWRDQHLYSFFSSLGRLAARPWANALTVLVLGFALALPLMFYLLFDNARDLAGGLREAREVTVFLQPAIDGKGAVALAAELRARADVADVLIRTPEEGLAEFRQLSGFGEALDALHANPLPTVLVVTPGAQSDLDAPPLLADLKADRRVDLVQYDATWRRKLSDILHFGERIVAVIAALLALATLLVIGNTVRMDIQARTAEISVMQLIGASDGFVRRPFLYAGFWYGLFGGICALAIVIAMELALVAPAQRVIESYGGRFALHGVGVLVALAVIGASALLGWLGAFVATARHLAAGQPQA